ncbi:steroid 17-alpha-hydroxylase/17,20 lyase-like [Oppia nitens]|uniref:steroid 17-alpha-hydroxylase/17,20 lyase-like n=1 Tax=Oppia nitens TaxID=1686743 RepID=UPI0023D9B49D|nr:steroid 17-alpha-hydroxylase/17,20 lyase-like [Oppia nitens]
MRKLAKKYGPIFTVYLGNSPQIVITDPVIARDVFNKSDFAGRTQSYLDYDPSIERDFCDTLIAAKNNALLREVGGKGSKQSLAKYLTDDKLGLAVFDIFFAGIDTTYNTFQWLLLFLANDLNVQKKLRKEISDKIGDRLPTLDDRHRCHYVMAFISETLRFRNIGPIGLAHKAIVDSKIGDYTIPKNMSVFVYQGFVLRNDSNKYWTNPNDFIPERFLDSDNHYMITRSQQTAFIPFGVGRRVCLGEKLAIADLFLVLIRFLQSTQNYDIVLDSHPGFDADPCNSDSITPNSYTIMFKSKS